LFLIADWVASGGRYSSANPLRSSGQSRAEAKAYNEQLRRQNDGIESQLSTGLGKSKYLVRWLFLK
jgi:hypothetical protein